MTPQMEQLDHLIDALNSGGAANPPDTTDPELAQLMNAVMRIRRCALTQCRDPQWRGEVVNNLSKALRSSNGAVEDQEVPPATQESIADGSLLSVRRSWPYQDEGRRYRMARVPHQIAQMAAAILVLVLVSGLLAIAFESQTPGNGDNDTTAPAGVSGVSVPDTLFATNFDRGSTLTSLLAYQPGSSSFQPVLDVGSPPVISPDGAQLFSGQVTQENDVVHIAVVALSSSSLNRQWTTEIASFPASKIGTGNLASAGASIAVTDKRVYVIPEVWNTRDPITVVVLDRQSGAEVARWSIPWVDKNASGGPLIYASPDGATLYLLGTTLDPATNQSTPPIYLRVSATDGHVEDRHELTSGGQRYFPSGRLTPDGDTLYSVGGWLPSSNDGVELQFFDLASGQLEPSLNLPFQNSGELLDVEEATSPDGRTLYVLSPTVDQVAIVDVQSRAVTKVVPVSGLTARSHSTLSRVIGEVRDWLVPAATAKFYFTGDMQLSPDGKRLYAVGVTGSGFEAAPNGVISIDTTTWNVVNRWMPNAQISYLQLGSDGYSLYVQTSDSSGQANLSLLDTRTGVASPVASDVPSYVRSLAQIYQAQFGKRPQMSDSGAAPSAPLARLDVSVDRTSILSGDMVTVDARFVDPGNGRLVQPDQTSVRFESPTQVTATFYHGQIGTDDVIVQLQQVDYGHYRGNAELKEPTLWSLRVDATRENAPGSRAEISNAVSVQNAFAATDGKRYVVELTTDPVQPVLDADTLVRVSLIDAESDSPMPDGVELTGGTLKSVEVAFFRGTPATGQASEMTSLTLRPAQHGSYEATTAFDATGSWEVQISLNQNGRATSTLVGSVQVVTP